MLPKFEREKQDAGQVKEESQWKGSALGVNLSTMIHYRLEMIMYTLILAKLNRKWYNSVGNRVCAYCYGFLDY